MRQPFLLKFNRPFPLTHVCIALCSLIQTDHISEVHTYSLHHQGALMMEAVNISETLVNFHKLYGATSKKTVNIILTTVTTSNLTYVQ
jgi:hypothetical protein